MGDKHYVAYRLVWKITHKEDPGRLEVCHNCAPNRDNPLCVNPKHLWLGEHKENSHDYWEKGGIPSFGNQRLSNDDYETIKAQHKGGRTINDIAKEFDIHRRTVWYIVTHR